MNKTFSCYHDSESLFPEFITVRAYFKDSYEGTTAIDLTFLTCSDGTPHPHAACGTISFSAQEPIFLEVDEDDDTFDSFWNIHLCTRGDLVIFSVTHSNESSYYHELWVNNWKTGHAVMVRLCS